jgi:hypothetical protein
VAFRFIAANTQPDHDSIASFRRRFLEGTRTLSNVRRQARLSCSTGSAGRDTREDRLWTVSPTADSLQPAQQLSRIRQEMPERYFCWLPWSSTAWRCLTRLPLQGGVRRSRQLCANAGYSFTTRNHCNFAGDDFFLPTQCFVEPRFTDFPSTANLHRRHR